MGAYLAYKAYEKQKKYLYISAGDGGTTIPAPGTYTYNVRENVTITAIPREGYGVGTWTVDGVEVAKQVNSITVTMDADHTVIVTFWEGGSPPPKVPVRLDSLGSVYVKSNVGAWLTGTPAVDQCCHVAHCDENWVKNALAKMPIRFKAVDAAGLGVPNVDVAFWTGSMPDGGRYRGTLLLNDVVHTVDFPLIVKTDSAGVATAYLSYVYGLADKFETLTSDANVGAQWGAAVVPCALWYAAKDGWCLGPLSYVCWTSGDCETGKAGCEKMGSSWQSNMVYGKIVGTAISGVEIAFCGFHVKWV